nr:MAG TPA: hypothetical protein [Caudoviricetes sp.]
MLFNNNVPDLFRNIIVKMNKLSFPPSFCFSYKKLLRFYETYFFSSIVNFSCFHLETRKCLLGNKAFFS